MIFHLRDLIPGDNVGVELEDGKWVRAMHLPFYGGVFDRARDAWAVLRGPEHAVAVHWPVNGEYERAVAHLDRTSRRIA